MTSIMVIESHELPRDICSLAAKELNLNMVFISTRMKDLTDDDYREYVRMAQEERMDAIIVSYHHSEKMSSYDTSVPIIPINFSNWETLNILQSLKKNIVDTHIPHPHKVALITVAPLSLDLKILSEIFELELHNIIRDGETLPDSFFHALKKEGFEIAACGSRYHQQVAASGMYHAYDPNAHSYIGVLEEFRRILKLITISRQVSQRNQELLQMMNYSFEAIWVTDDHGLITSYNVKAAGLFAKNTHKASPSFSGRSIYEVLPAQMKDILDDALSNGTNYYSHLLLHTQSDGIFNITPLMRNGTVSAVIFHFTALPHLEQMEEQIRIESYIKGHKAKYTFQNLIGKSGAIQRAIKNAELFAKYDSNILLIGETGTGKEIFSQSIHNSSRRSGQPFVALNCGALPPNLLESELFGYVEGAFTGASRKGKKGLFEIANQGTIFLDEISEMDANGQLRLLRVLEEREVMRIGSDSVIPVNVRVIAACNKDLAKLVKNGSFREDLFYRLNVLTIQIPALRERGNDVFLLAEYYLDIYSQKYQKTVQLSSASASMLTSYPWPGNVRQLRNFCERLVIVADDYQLSPEFIKDQLQQAYQFYDHTDDMDTAVLPALSLPGSERDNILLALRQTKGNRQQTASLLNISTSTLWRKMKKYGIMENY